MTNQECVVEMAEKLLAIGFEPQSIHGGAFDPSDDDRFKINLDALWVVVIARTGGTETRFTIDAGIAQGTERMWRGLGIILSGLEESRA